MPAALSQRRISRPPARRVPPRARLAVAAWRGSNSLLDAILERGVGVVEEVRRRGGGSGGFCGWRKFCICCKKRRVLPLKLAATVPPAGRAAHPSPVSGRIPAAAVAGSAACPHRCRKAVASVQVVVPELTQIFRADLGVEMTGIATSGALAGSSPSLSCMIWSSGVSLANALSRRSLTFARWIAVCAARNARILRRR